MKKILLSVLLFACFARAETVVTSGYAVQVSGDGLTTIPPNSIATPAQTEAVGMEASEAKAAADIAAGIAAAAYGRTSLYSTNYVVTSTVYCQSIGGVPYDPSNQTIRVHSVAVTETNVVIVGTVRQSPLVTPTLDWRQAVNTGAWSNLSATVTQVAVPAGVTNAAAAYQFALARPAAGRAFFRIVDNSTGASGSGLYWVVFGAIHVDGHKGFTGTITNVVGSVTNFFLVRGGSFVEPEPLGGF